MLLKFLKNLVNFEFKAEYLRIVKTHAYFILHIFRSTLSPINCTCRLGWNLFKLLFLLIFSKNIVVFEIYRSNGTAKY